jgi:hypothetical protein
MAVVAGGGELRGVWKTCQGHVACGVPGCSVPVVDSIRKNPLHTEAIMARLLNQEHPSTSREMLKRR